MKKLVHPLLYFIFFLILLQTIIAFVIDIHSPCNHDECHFYETVKEFGSDMSMETIKHYSEMSTPLPFILYALWGRIFGFELHVLRVFSMLIAFLTYFIFYKLLYVVFRNHTLSFLVSAFYALNPYMIGLTVYVYTDMLGILFLVMSCYALIKQVPALLALASAAMLLCRQYLLFFAAAVLVYLLFRYIVEKKKALLHLLIACIISLVPLLLLFIVWKGFSPDNDMRRLYVSEGLSFTPNYFTLYVCLFLVYLFPIMIFVWRIIYGNYKVLIGSFIFSMFYWIFPVIPSKYAMSIDVYTVGFFHRFLKMIFNDTPWVHIVFFLTFLLGLPLIFYLLKDSYERVRCRNFDDQLFFDLAILTFLVAMPFSYLVWEKYFLPIMPVAMIRILLVRYSIRSNTVI